MKLLQLLSSLPIHQRCQSGAVVRSMFEINITAMLSPRRSWVRFPVKPIPNVIEKATLSNSVRFLWGLLFPPRTLQSPNIVY
jgi:hypothetical protein